uniref:Sialate O-acetylesterase-like n=1 Tax=Phallusia mammillata TaxID=59560 RepID=A0A6F9DT66_9ASCI|nr:sialate O-acetylesterase-like [Phallusia mammillata]
MNTLLLFCCCGVALIGNAASDNDFAFASYFQNNMVLQREPHRAVIWGYGTVGAIVNVSIIQDVYSTKVKAGPNGKGVWSVTFRPQPVGGAQQIQGVQDNHGLLNWILLKNVLFGDVWICSGQSNMQFTVSMMFNVSHELEIASNYPNVRVMTPGQNVSDTPLHDLLSIEQGWSVASKESIGGQNDKYFSAVCWLYGRHLNDVLKVPIGLIASDWGGTPVETWSSTEALTRCGLDKKDFNITEHPTWTKVPNKNSVLWNAMIHPFLNMTIKGAIWYQGEANAEYHADKYACTFPAMISDWRWKWYNSHKQTDVLFPFGFVQLATNNVTDDGSFPKIRWHQTADYGFVPNEVMRNTFMAVAMDLRDDASPFGAIHPRYKEDVGIRLALSGLRIAYGQQYNSDGPIVRSAVRTNDGHVVVSYPHDQSLVVTDQKNFEVCCSFSKCNAYDPFGSADWVLAPIASHSTHTITLDAKFCSNKGGKPVYMRYAWALEPCQYKQCSVYNDLGLPAPPFGLLITDF